MTQIEAALDIGSNTILLLIAEIELSPKRRIVRILEDARQIPRLGQGIHQNRKFSDEAMKRAMDALKSHKSICEKHSVQKIHAVATSASRDASNSSDFYSKVKTELGIDVQIIHGTKEARLSFLGGLLSDQDPNTHALIDIGGGSTEFVYLDGDVHGQSIDMGCVRGTEMYLSGDPYTPESIDKMMKSLPARWEELSGSMQENLRSKNWVAIAGTPTILAGLDQGLPRFIPEKIDGHVLVLDRIKEIFDDVAKQTHEVREANPLMGPGRADLMVAGTGILITAMQYFKKDKVVVSIRGLRHGLLSEPIN